MKKVIVTKVRKCKGVKVKMNYLEDFGEDVKNSQQCYLFKFFTDDEVMPIFSKIGTTGKSCNERLRDEIGEYREKGFNILSVDIAKIYQCGDLPAEAFESFLRAYFIKDYPNTWRKNDRFFGADVDVDKFVKLCKMFSEL